MSLRKRIGKQVMQDGEPLFFTEEKYVLSLPQCLRNAFNIGRLSKEAIFSFSERSASRFMALKKLFIIFDSIACLEPLKNRSNQRNIIWTGGSFYKLSLQWGVVKYAAEPRRRVCVGITFFRIQAYQNTRFRITPIT